MRQRWIYPSNGDAPYQVGDDYVALRYSNTDAALWGDRNYDGMDPRFNSRTQHREFMKLHGLTTVDDYPKQWAAEEKRHREILNGVDPNRRADIERAIHTLQQRGRRT